MVQDIIKEVKSKVIHIAILLIISFFFVIKTVFSAGAAKLFLVALLIFLLVLEFLRLELKIKVPFFSKFIRPKEEYSITGSVFFLSSALICLAVFDTSIALAALLMTTFGDMVAAISGKLYGTTMLFKNKTVVGFDVGLLTNLAIGILISLFFTLNIYVPIIMAFVASGIELIVSELDDNLVVPITCGFVGQILLLSL